MAAVIVPLDVLEVLVERPKSVTPAQRLLRRMSWLDGQERLYQPVALPEVATWPLMRRCTDRLAMMLDFLGHRAAHDAVLGAIEAVLDPKNGGPRTPDMGGTASTSDLGKAIAEAL